jgi:SAM-dependent methyltransferase
MNPKSVPLRCRELDRVNRRTYRSRGAVRQYGVATGWLEPGERLAIEHATATARDAPILDIGIGGGRTAPLMTAVSHDYVGIDYIPSMVETARRRFPSLCFQEMDARILRFADGSFQLVTFSYNGIDSVDPAGRLEILQQVHRVLRPGGCFVFSTLNLHGTAWGASWPDWSVFRAAGPSATRLAHAVAKLALGGINRLRARSAMRVHIGAAIGAISAHNFGLLVVFTSLGEQLRQLKECGFQVEAIFEPSGRRLPPDGSEATEAPWCHFVARRP